jgi:hypothetical protein
MATDSDSDSDYNCTLRIPGLQERLRQARAAGPAGKAP